MREMTRYHCLLCNFIVLLFSDIVHSVKEATLDLALVKEITFYTVTPCDNDYEFIFQNPQISTDTLTFNFGEIIINEELTHDNLVVFSLARAPNKFYTIVFIVPYHAAFFSEDRILLSDAEIESASETRTSAATATNAPYIVCSRYGNGEKYFQVIAKRNPAFNLEFDFKEVYISDHPSQDAKLVEIKHRRLSKLYKLYFKNVDHQIAFMEFYND